MKLTKFIRDTIAERVDREVRKKYDLQNIDDMIEKEKKEKREMLEAFKEEATQRLIDIIEKNGYKLKKHSWRSSEPLTINEYNIIKECSASEMKDNTLDKMHEEIRTKTANIILALEFGGARSNFEAIISEELSK